MTDFILQLPRHFFSQFASNCNTTCPCFLPDYKGGFVKHLNLTQAAQQSVTKVISLIFVNLVTPKSRAKHELLFNKPATEARAQFVQHLSQTQAAQQSVVKIV